MLITLSNAHAHEEIFVLEKCDGNEEIIHVSSKVWVQNGCLFGPKQVNTFVCIKRLLDQQGCLRDPGKKSQLTSSMYRVARTPTGSVRLLFPLDGGDSFKSDRRPPCC